MFKHAFCSLLRLGMAAAGVVTADAADGGHDALKVLTFVVACSVFALGILVAPGKIALFSMYARGSDVMKKTLIAGFVLALCSQGVMAANDWRFAAGADVWSAQGSGQAYGHSASNYDDNYNWNGYLQLEHGIIFLPNAKFEISDFSTSGGAFKNDLTAYDLSLYYRLFNNDLFKIDLGMTGRHYDGEQVTWGRQGYSEDTLMAYAGSEMNIPGTGIAFFGDVRAHDADNVDYRLGGSYKFSTMPIKVRAGWRDAKVDFANIDQRVDGWFMGGEFTF